MSSKDAQDIYRELKRVRKELISLMSVERAIRNANGSKIS